MSPKSHKSHKSDSEHQAKCLKRKQDEKNHPLSQYNNGTILQLANDIYCLQYGLDGRILVNVNTGLWQFIVDVPPSRTYHVKWLS